MYEQRDNSGSLFKNDKKTTDKHPDYKGTVMVNGVEYWISSWLKTGKSGVKFMSLAFTPKEPQTVHEAAPAQQPDFNDDIPF